MFSKSQFKDFLRFRKNFSLDKFKLIVGDRKTFTNNDIVPALKEMSKDYPAQLLNNEFIKSER